MYRVILVYLVAALATCVGQTQWNARADFSFASNPGGAWSYGAKSTPTSAYVAMPAFTAFTGFATGNANNVGNVWYLNAAYPNVYYPMVSRDGLLSDAIGSAEIMMHPGYQAPADVACLRWTAPSTGFYRVHGQFRYAYYGARTVHVNFGGAAAPVLSVTMNGSIPLVPFEYFVGLSQGQAIDFMVNTVGHNAGTGTFVTASVEAIDFLQTDVSLVASSILISPSSPLVGQTIAFTVSGTNGGQQSATTSVDFFDGDPATGGVLIGSQTHTLGFGQFATFGTTWTPTSPGLRQLYAVATNLSGPDATTTNNQALANVWVNAPFESLVVQQSEVTGWVGGSFQTAFSIQNTGSAPATITGLLSSSPWVSFANLPPVDPLPPGQSVQIVADVAIPAGAMGGVGVPQVHPLGISVLTSTNGVYGGTLVARVFSAPPLTTTVTVTDQTSGLPLAGATVAVDGVTATFSTNGAGQTAIPLPEGQRGFYAYKTGYVAGQTIATVSAASPNVGVALEPGQTMTVQTVVSQPLTTQQIIDRGVVVQDPVNNVVLDFVVVLAPPTPPPGSPPPPPPPPGTPPPPPPPPLVIPNIEIPANPPVGSVVTFSVPYFGGPITGGGGGGGGSGGGYVAATFTYPQPNVRHETWIIIPGSVWALKEFREATILVRNNATATPASAIRFENVSASINVPAGLALPDLNGVPQPLSKTLGTAGVLNAGEQAQAVWVIRGDVPGQYQLTGSASGNLWLGSPGTQIIPPVTASAVSDFFQVELPQLRLAFQTPTDVVAGQPFNFGVLVTNEGAATAQLVRVSLKVEDLVECSPDPTQPNPNCAPCINPATPTVSYYDAFSNVTRLEIDLGDLPPGATAGGQFSLISHVTGRIVDVESQVWNSTTASPPVTAAARYPGTSPSDPNGGCLMLTGVNVPFGAGDAGYRKSVPNVPGSTLAISVATTNPALLGHPYLLVIDAFTPNGAFDLPPVPYALPGLWVGPNSVVVLNGATQGFVLVPGGNHLHFPVPVGLSGFHLMLQAATGAPGGFCATDAHELTFE